MNSNHEVLKKETYTEKDNIQPNWKGLLEYGPHDTLFLSFLIISLGSDAYLGKLSPLSPQGTWLWSLLRLVLGVNMDLYFLWNPGGS